MEQVSEPIYCNFDSERYQRWMSPLIVVQGVGQPATLNKNSHWFWVYEITRGLARFDARLVVEDQWAASLFQDESRREAECDRYLDHVIASQLWVLGAYELIRIVVEKLKEKEKFDKAIHEKSLKEIKKRNKRQGQKKIESNVFNQDPLLLRAKVLLRDFERLRMPMAKLQPAKEFKADNPIARPGLSGGGVGWTTGAEMFVTRTELADKMIMVLSGYTRDEMAEKYQQLTELLRSRQGV